MGGTHFCITQARFRSPCVAYTLKRIDILLVEYNLLFGSYNNIAYIMLVPPDARRHARKDVLCLT